MTTRALPSGWEWKLLGEVATIESNLVSPADHAQMPHIAPNHIESWTGRLLPYTTVAQDGVKSPKHLFRAGQVIYSKIRPYLAKATLVDFDGLCSADMYPLSTRLDPRFLLRWLLTPEFTNRVVQDQGRTVLPKVNQEALMKVPVPVPPMDVQRRIVAKLDALLAQSRAAREQLEAVPALVEQYRQSVLAAAFRGDLTADWRKKNPDVEPASKLLERIRIERRQKWEAAELAKLKAKGKSPKDDKWKSKYVEPEPVDTSDLPELPPTWCWAPLGQLCALKGGITLGKKREPSDMVRSVPYLRVANVQRGHLTLDEMKSIEATEAEISELALKIGDVLFNEGGDRDKLGRGWVWEGQLKECIHQNHVFRGRPVLSEVLPELLSQYGNSAGQRYFLASAKQTTNLASINLTQLSRMPVALAPSDEQVVLQRALRDSLRTDAVVDGVEEVSNLADTAERALLAKAFRGELVS